MLERFYAELKNKHGEDYEPESLKVMIASLDRHWLAAASAHTKLDSCPKRKKKFSGRVRNSVVKLQNP